MNETIIIENGKNIIDIIDDGFVTCLKIRKPIAIYCWYYCEENSCNYFLLNTDHERIDNLYSFNETLVNGNDEEIKNEINLFLNIFASGKYKISFDNGLITNNEDYSELNMNYININGSSIYSYSYCNSETYSMMFTQPYSYISQKKVNYYREIIKNGGRPKIITFENTIKNIYDNTIFILDGHHKALAYFSLKIPAETISIVKLDKEEDDNIKNSLYSEYEYLLTDFYKHHIISNNPKLLLDNSSTSIKYNDDFDKYLKTFDKYISGDIIRLIYKSFISTNIEEQKWGLRKLRIIEKRDFFTEKIILWNVVDEHLSLQACEIKSNEEFDSYILRTFGKSLDNIEKNIT